MTTRAKDAVEAMLRCGGNLSEAAADLRITRQALYGILHRAGVQPSSLRERCQRVSTVTTDADELAPVNPQPKVQKAQGVNYPGAEGGPIVSAMSTETTRPAEITRRPWVPRLKPDIKDMFRAAKLRLLVEAKLETDEDHILEGLVRQYLEEYVDRVVRTPAPKPKGEK